MKKLDELTNEELDRYCALAQGWDFIRKQRTTYGCVYNVWANGMQPYIEHYHPTSNWQQAGELMEKYEIDLSKADNWWANVQGQDDVIEGDTPQRAICLAVVASKYPEGVPDE